MHHAETKNPHFYAILPPVNTHLRNRSKVIFGFPIPEEWLASRYQVELAAQRAAAGNTESASRMKRYDSDVKAFRDLVRICNVIHPNGPWIRVVIAETMEYGDGSVDFLVVGRPGLKPPDDILLRLRIALLKCNIFEIPGWYPRLY